MLARSLIPIVALFLCVLIPVQAAASILIGYNAEATVCPAGPQAVAPDFTSPNCERLVLTDIDPQKRELWVRIEFSADPARLPAGEPVGLFVSVKSSSAVWLNGTDLGANGTPAKDRAGETPGLMDAVYYVPDGLLRNGANELVLHLSSHHGFLRLEYPFHYLLFDQYVDPTREILRAYAPSMITLGAFVLGAIYFGVASLRNRPAGASVWLFVLSLLAIAQLMLETSRGLFPYRYPFHDLRLVLIAASAASFGLCLLFHTATKFLNRQAPVVAAGAGATALIVIFASGFDAKTAFGMLAPVMISAMIAVIAALNNKPGARNYAIALGLFIGLFALFPGQFLDTGFFYSIAALLLFLMGQEALLFARERTLRSDANDRARRLELALEKARQQNAPQRLKIQSAGKTSLIAAGDIVYCKGAGDYVEIFVANGGPHLHLAKLQELEAELPSAFVRVHRSYIVNTDHVKSLTRESTGVGTLMLSNGDSVPVSRRILPNVRSVLA